MRRLLAVAAAVLTVVAAGPYLLSTDTAVGIATALVNDRIYGRLNVEAVSLGWFSPIELRGVHLADRSDREVLYARRVELPGPLIGRVVSPTALGKIHVDAARLVLYRTAGGEFSLNEALRARRAKTPGGPPRPLPHVSGEAVLRDCSVGIVQPDGRRYELPRVSGKAAIRPGPDGYALDGDIHIVPAGGGSLDCKLSLAGLGGPASVHGRLNVSTAGAVDLGPIGRFAWKDVLLAGRAELSAKADLRRDGAVAGRFDLHVAALRAARPDGTSPAPLDGTIRGRAELAGASRQNGATAAGTVPAVTVGNVSIASPAGAITASFRYSPSRQAEAAGPKLTARAVLDALLTGRDIHLPDFEVNADGRIDLARLAAAIPALLRVRPDVKLQAAAVEIEHLSAAGGERPRLAGLFSLRGLAASRGGRKMAWPAMTMRLDTAIEPGRGLRVGGIHLAGPFGTLDAAGSVRDLAATCHADLAGLRRQLGEIFELPDFELAGRADWTLRIHGAADRTTVTLSASAAGLHLVLPAERPAGTKAARGRMAAAPPGKAAASRPGQPARTGQAARPAVRFDVPRLLAAASGAIDHPDGRIAAVRLDGASLEAGGLLLAGSGVLDANTGAMSAHLALRRGTIERVVELLGGAAPRLLRRFSGGLAGAATLNRPSGKAPLVIDGQLRIDRPRLDANALSDGPIEISWSGASLAPAAGALDVASLTARSEVAVVRVSKLSAAAHGRPVATANVDITAEVCKCLDLARRFSAGPPKKPRAGGAAGEPAGRIQPAGTAAANAGARAVSMTRGPTSRPDGSAPPARLAPPPHLAGRLTWS
ncbi:MAG: hypothetical protein J7M21_06280, partial [Planctomycetes bacterium]|nr:hypothetical protein [Planctomycetota bacterium]